MKPSQKVGTKTYVQVILAGLSLAFLAGCPPLFTTPTAAFTATPAEGSLPLNVVFTDKSDGGGDAITAWTWDFGDGATSTEPNPSHAYVAEGEYVVQLRVETRRGSANASQIISVTAAADKPAFSSDTALDGLPPGTTVSMCRGKTARFRGTVAGNNPLTKVLMAVLPSGGDWQLAFEDSNQGQCFKDLSAYAFETGLESSYASCAGVYTVRLQAYDAYSATGTAPYKEWTVVVSAGGSTTPEWYVKPGGSGQGTSWKKAFGDIQEAIDAAAAAGGGNIWVAAGRYIAHEKKSAYVVRLAKDVHLYGGFAANETQFYERNWNKNETIIDGEFQQSCVRGADAATLDGFVIRNGYAIEYGAGMYNRAASPEVAHCTFYGNTTQNNGGGLYNKEHAMPVLTDCVFIANTAHIGGGMCNEAHSSPTLNNCMFIANSALQGGAVSNGDDSSPVFNQCTFLENSVSYSGGGTYDEDSSAVYSGCAFAGNRSRYGGGSYAGEGSSLIFTNCIFTENNGHTGGGIVDDNGVSLVLTNCTFAGNQASTCAGLRNGAKIAQISYCTFTANCTFASGGAMENISGETEITSCVFWGDKQPSGYGEIYINDNYGGAMPPVITYSCIQDGYEGTGNISSDPLFSSTTKGDYSLRPGSPCIGTGLSGDNMGSYYQPNQAQFAATPTHGVAPLVVHFAGEEYFSAGAVAWAWSFGDGDTSTAKNPVHTYTSNGLYTVTLTVTTPHGTFTKSKPACVNVRDHWYVKANGTGSGTSWKNACGSIQEAVDAASAAGGGEVWVAAGKYVARESTAPYVLAMAYGVHVYGGFSGSETVREARDWERNPSVIDGELKRRCVQGAANATLDGFTIQKGYSKTAGAGMYNENVSPTIANCIFYRNETSNNYAANGAGIYNENASPIIENCLFSENQASGAGGGLANAWLASPIVSGCVFDSNTGDFNGGGMYNWVSSPKVFDCIFTGNFADEGGGMCAEEYSSPEIINCVFTGNIARYGGGMSIAEKSSPSLNLCNFSENHASSGGGIYNNWQASLIVSNSVLTNNTATYEGGAVYNTYTSSLMCINCTLGRNVAVDDAGGIYSAGASSLKLINCILWADVSTGINNEIFNEYSSDDPSISEALYSCIQGGYPGTGNIDADPLFVDPANGDYRLQAGSPCIDAGTADGAPETDLLGATRPQGLGVDMGAYEYTSR